MIKELLMYLQTEQGFWTFIFIFTLGGMFFHHIWIARKVSILKSDSEISLNERNVLRNRITALENDMEKLFALVENGEKDGNN